MDNGRSHRWPFRPFRSDLAAILRRRTCTRTRTHTRIITFLAAAIKHAVRVKARLPGRYIVLYIPRVIRRCKSRKGCCSAAGAGRRRYIIIYIRSRGQTWSADGRRAFLHGPPPTDPHRTCGNAVPKIANTYPARHIIIYTRTYLYMYTCRRVRHTYIYYTGYMGRI